MEHIDALNDGELVDDHMTHLEVAFANFGKAFTLDEIQHQDPEGFAKNKDVAVQGGERAGRFRQQYEEESGRQVICNHP